MKTRSLTEGAMLGAITVLLSILGEYIGVPSIIVPIPLMLLVYRQGFQYGTLAAVAAALISSLVAGHVFSGLTIIIWGVVGIALGMALRERLSFSRLMLVGIMANLIVMGLNFLLYSLIIGGNILQDLLVMFTESIDQAIKMSESMGVTGEALQQYEAFKVLVPMMLRLGFPSMLLVYAVSMSYINLAIGRMVLKRLGDTSTPWLIPFIEWRLPSYFGLFLAFGLVITTLVQIVELPTWLQFVGYNSFLLSFYAYIVAGISLAWYYFRQKSVPTFLRIFLIFLLFTTQFLLIILIILVVVDGIFDFRRLKASSDEPIEVEHSENERDEEN